MPELWFTSDTHFGHKRMLEFRGYEDVVEMDKDLIRCWNSRISPKDRVYHLGDFSFHNRGRTHGVIDALNGSICLIRGNHDERIIKGDLEKRFEWVKYQYFLKIDKQTQIMMNHCAFLTWWGSHRGSWCLHGHSHGSLIQNQDPKGPRRMDVGVDTNDMYPYHLEEIRKHMATRSHEVVDHHRERKA